MLYPWQIAQFRTSIRDGGRGVFQNHVFAGDHISLGESAGTKTYVELPQEMLFEGPAQIFGAPELPACLQGVATSKVLTPSKILYTLRHARIIGLTAALDSDNHLYIPNALETEDDLRFALSLNRSNAQGFVLEQLDQEPMAFYFRAREPKKFPLKAFFVPDPEKGNYGSFIFRILPQLMEFRNLQIAFDCYVTSCRASWFVDALRLLKLPEKPIFEVEEMCGEEFEIIYMFNMFYSEGLCSPSTRKAFETLSKRVQKTNSEPALTKLYISRSLSRISKPHYRPLDDEVAIEREMLSEGFHVVYPETLSLSRQIAIFSQSNKMIGPSGSGMLNVVFASDGGKVVDIESFTVAVRQHAKIYSSTGKKYAFCFGKFDDEDDREVSVRRWRVEPHLLRHALDWLHS